MIKTNTVVFITIGRDILAIPRSFGFSHPRTLGKICFIMIIIQLFSTGTASYTSCSWNAATLGTVRTGQQPAGHCRIRHC